MTTDGTTNAPAASAPEKVTAVRALSARVGEARRQVSRGEVPMLDSLLGEVESAMNGLVTAGAGNRDLLEPLLLSLLEEVDGLIAELEAARDAARETARDASLRRRATDAYAAPRKGG